MKKFYLENKIFIRIAGIALLLFVVAFIVFYGTNDLFVLPLDSGVWGTASDWMMVAVTIVTAGYLIKTFKEQKNTNEFERKKYIKSIAPKFSVENHLMTDSEAGLPNSCESIPTREYYLKLMLLENDARDVKFTAICKAITHTFAEKTYMKSNDEREVVYIEFNRRIQSKEPQVKEEIMLITYKDVELNEYSQTIYMNNSEFALEAAVSRHQFE